MMQTQAAVVVATHDLSIETVELDEPKAGEVLVRLEAAGVCHSDLHVYHGEMGTAPPLVLGHEGAGVVEAIGAGVTRVKPGDTVIINWLPACENCTNCLNEEYNSCERIAETNFNGHMLDGTTRIKRADGTSVKHYLGAATMAQHTIVSEAGVIPIPDDVPFDVAAIIGCAVVTGVGAVINTAQATTGSSAAVIGCGGIGLSVIQGCKLAGCYPIIAVDMVAEKLDFARTMGATHTINGKETKVFNELLAMGRPDFVFDSVGAAATIPQALKSARPGGAAVIVGLHAAAQKVPISPATLVFENKRLYGSFVGSSRPRTDLPKLIELYRGGRLDLDTLITARYTLDQVDQAFDDMLAGKILGRGVLTFN
ncbi:MAG: Zn-dependent alcohol dehydrogenase [Chloroflexota bacterium]